MEGGNELAANAQERAPSSPALPSPVAACRQPAAGQPDGRAPLHLRPAAPAHRPHPLVWRAHRWAARGAGAVGGAQLVHGAAGRGCAPPLHAPHPRSPAALAPVCPPAASTRTPPNHPAALPLSSQWPPSTSRRGGAPTAPTSSQAPPTARCTSGRCAAACLPGCWLAGRLAGFPSCFRCTCCTFWAGQLGCLVPALPVLPAVPRAGRTAAQLERHQLRDRQALQLPSPSCLALTRCHPRLRRWTRPTAPPLTCCRGTRAR